MVGSGTFWNGARHRFPPNTTCICDLAQLSTTPDHDGYDHPYVTGSLACNLANSVSLSAGSCAIALAPSSLYGMPKPFPTTGTT